MTLPLLIGECPSASGNRYYHFPLSGAVGKRLCEFAGIPPDDEGSKYGKWYWALRERFDCINAIEKYEDSTPWRPEVARARVWHYLDENPADVVIALGVRAMEALAPNLRGIKWFEHKRSEGRHVVMIPHPSTRNLLYNYEATRNQAGVVLRTAMNYRKEETHGLVQQDGRTR